MNDDTKTSGSRRLSGGASRVFLAASLAALGYPSVPGRAGEPAVAPQSLPPEGSRYVLPNGWALTPAGRQFALGGLPLKLTPHPDGRHLLVMSNGATEHFVGVFDLERERLTHRSPIERGWLGLAVSPDGRSVYASAGGDDALLSFRFERGLLTPGPRLRLPAKTFAAGLAFTPKGDRLLVAANVGNALLVVDPARGEVTASIPVGPKPYACAVSPDGRRTFVSNWGGSSVTEVDLQAGRAGRTFRVQEHPNDLVLTPDGSSLFVANGNRNTVSVVDTASGTVTEQIDVALTPSSPPGSTPNALALSPDGRTLLVANADNNALAVIDVERPRHSRPLGFIPTGWYPTAVAFSTDGKRVAIANGKGNVSRPNAALVDPKELPSWRSTHPGYLINMLEGTLSVVERPDARRLAEYSAQAQGNSPYGKVDPRVAKPPFALGHGGPIQHVIYVIKENRTYDQVFGDMKEGDGDPVYCLFPEAVTPNHHALARQFVLFDNLYHNAEVSADGHHWVTGAYATDYIQKSWPAKYGGRDRRPDDDDNIADSSAGYLWALCRKAGLSFRAYGETTGMDADDQKPASNDPLDAPVHPTYDAWGQGDLKAIGLWLDDLRAYEKRGRMPSLQVISLPGDHTDGTAPGSRTPRAMVAANDLALGRLVEAVTRSRFWPSTAIFVIEDDPQDGPDHVDVHRTVALVVSPVTRRQFVDHTPYSSFSLLRTIEAILGLPPMTQYDAAATPMWASFQARPDTSPYRARPAAVPLDEMNLATAYGAERARRWDLRRPDAIPDAEFNEILWKACKGTSSALPPRKVAAFVREQPTGDPDEKGKAGD